MAKKKRTLKQILQEIEKVETRMRIDGLILKALKDERDLLRALTNPGTYRDGDKAIITWRPAELIDPGFPLI